VWWVIVDCWVWGVFENPEGGLLSVSTGERKRGSLTQEGRKSGTKEGALEKIERPDHPYQPD